MSEVNEAHFTLNVHSITALTVWYPKLIIDLHSATVVHLHLDNCGEHEYATVM